MNASSPDSSPNSAIFFKFLSKMQFHFTISIFSCCLHWHVVYGVDGVVRCTVYHFSVCSDYSRVSLSTGEQNFLFRICLMIVKLNRI